MLLLLVRRSWRWWSIIVVQTPQSHLSCAPHTEGWRHWLKLIAWRGALEWIDSSSFRAPRVGVNLILNSFLRERGTPLKRQLIYKDNTKVRVIPLLAMTYSSGLIVRRACVSEPAVQWGVVRMSNCYVQNGDCLGRKENCEGSVQRGHLLVA